MRQPAVADQFYPGSPKSLSRTITKLYPSFANEKKEKALAVVSPHAGYVYSGALAAETFSGVEIPETVIILGPNHRGLGASIALSGVSWNMPLGEVPVDMETVNKLVENSRLFSVDELSHNSEHSLEVQVPFLQMLQEKLRIVPLVLSQLSYSLCEEVAHSLAHVIRQSDKEILIVASSDMSHYEPRESAEKKDNMALKTIAELNPQDLYNTVLTNRISMCGFIPVVIALLAAKTLGARTSRLVGYTDSGHVSGDTTQVVGYAGFIVK